MKKSLVVFAILSTMILASCGGKAVETVATDSTEVVVVELSSSEISISSKIFDKY